MGDQDQLKAAKAHVAAKIYELVVQTDPSALETAGRFTGFLEAYRAIEIAQAYDTVAEQEKDAEDYRQGVLRNLE